MIAFSGISKQYGRQILFVDASFQLNPGDKVGLVGPNGSGKTTIFRMITGEEVAAGQSGTLGFFHDRIVNTGTIIGSIATGIAACVLTWEATARYLFKIPSDWQVLFGAAAGVAVFSRKFHRPTNLEPHEQVVLHFKGIAGHGEIRLNDVVLMSFPETNGSLECEITNSMQAFNRLEIQLQFDPLQSPSTRGGLFDDVAIEIRTVS